jgi:3-oxoacyl-[acyl-carrier-protein] synthase-3
MEQPDIHLLSAAGALPGPPVDNARLAALFGAERAWRQWVDAFIGTDSRHFSVDLETNEVEEWLADLGATAGERALRGAGLPADEVDLLVLATSTPDTLMPATVNIVADRLGIDGVPTYQLQSGCTGAVQAIEVARQMLLSGKHRNALVLGGDVCAKLLDAGLDPARATPADLVNVAMFGDGAGAVVLSTSATAGSVALRHVEVRLSGRGRPPGHTVDWYGPASRGSGTAATSEDYRAIERLVPELAEQTLDRLAEAVGWRRTDIDYLLPPQLSGRMTARIVQRIGLDGAKEVSCVRETGNTGNALPFLQLERLLPLLESGDRAVAVAIESSKWIEAGFVLERTG